MNKKVTNIVARIIVAFIGLLGLSLMFLLLGLVVKGGIAVWSSIL